MLNLTTSLKPQISTIVIASVGGKRAPLQFSNIYPQFKMGHPLMEILFLGIYSVEILTQVFKEFSVRSFISA